MMKHTLVASSPERFLDAPYLGTIDGKDAIMRREYDSTTPNGNAVAGRWVLRIDGVMVDFDQYRNDLAERHNIELRHSTAPYMDPQ